MKSILLRRWPAPALVFVAFIAVHPAHADTTTTQSAPTDQQLMKDCIRKHETSDVSQSKSQLTRICKDEIKQRKITGTPPPPPPPTDGPQAQPPVQ